MKAKKAKEAEELDALKERIADLEEDTVSKSVSEQIRKKVYGFL